MVQEPVWQLRQVQKHIVGPSFQKDLPRFGKGAFALWQSKQSRRFARKEKYPSEPGFHQTIFEYAKVPTWNSMLLSGAFFEIHRTAPSIAKQKNPRYQVLVLFL